MGEAFANAGAMLSTENNKVLRAIS